MNKQQKLRIALPVLAVIMFFVWKPVLMGSGPKGKDKGASQPAKDNSLSVSQSEFSMLLSAEQKQRARSAYQDWGRNPFALGQKQDTLMIEGILWDQQSPKVMINGNILGVGEKFGSVTIVDIKPNTVILKDKDAEVELGPGGTM